MLLDGGRCTGRHNRDTWRLVTTLVQQGADVNAEDNDGDRPLHEAALTGHVEAVATLVSSERT